MERLRRNPTAYLRVVAIIAAGVAVGICLRRFLFPMAKIVLSASGIALIISPLCRAIEKKLSRGISAVLSVLALAGAFAIAASVIPLLALDFADFIMDLAESIKPAFQAISGLAGKTGVDISGAMDSLSSKIISLGAGAINAIGSTISGAAGLIISLVICIFILKDREILMLRCEMVVPVRFRERAVRCACEVYSDLMLYFRAQLIISLCVGALSALGLTVIGVPYSVPLGLLAGIFNVVPYLGPIIASVPIALCALSEGLPLAAMAVVIMVAVQQIDGLIISPRIMGSVTGFPTPVVMISIYCAGAAFGILGMLLVMPGLILTRTCVRVFVESGRNH